MFLDLSSSPCLCSAFGSASRPSPPLPCLGTVWFSPAGGAPGSGAFWGLWGLAGCQDSGFSRCCVPNSLEENKSRGFAAGGRDLAASQPRRWPQLLGAVPARGQVHVLPGAQVRFPTGCTGLAPALCLVNKVSFGINLSLWSLSWRGMPGKRRRRREWDVLNRPNTGLGAQLAARGCRQGWHRFGAWKLGALDPKAGL